MTITDATTRPPLQLPATVTITAEYHEWLAAQSVAMPSAEYLASYSIARLGDDDPMVIAYRKAQAEMRRAWAAYVAATA